MNRVIKDLICIRMQLQSSTLNLCGFVVWCGTFELLKVSVHMHNVSVVIWHICVFVFLSFRHFCHDQQNVCSHRWSSWFIQKYFCSQEQLSLLGRFLLNFIPSFFWSLKSQIKNLRKGEFRIHFWKHERRLHWEHSALRWKIYRNKRGNRVLIVRHVRTSDAPLDLVNLWYLWSGRQHSDGNCEIPGPPCCTCIVSTFHWDVKKCLRFQDIFLKFVINLYCHVNYQPACEKSLKEYFINETQS